MTHHQTKPGEPSVMETALLHHQEGRLDDAEKIYQTLLALSPNRPDVLHLLGLVQLQRGAVDAALHLIARSLSLAPENPSGLSHLGEAHRLRGDLDAAEKCHRHAIEINPLLAEAHNNLGVVLQEQGRNPEATAAFELATAARPGWGDAHFNLGLSRKQNGDLSAAAQAFAHGWLSNRPSFDAAAQCVATLAELARHDVSPYPRILGSQPLPSLPFISVIFCSVDDNKCRRTMALYERLLSTCRHEIIGIRDARSLSEAYNRGVRKCRGDIIVLSHDDIDILDGEFAAHLSARLERDFDVVGVVGGTTMRGPTWACSGHPHLRGWITHTTPSGKYIVGALHPSSVGHGLMTLDGVFLAARADVFKAVPFDEDMFDGFHLYDIDWSYRAAQAGFRLGTVGDLLLVHESRGKFDSLMKEYASRFCFKHQVEAQPGDSSTMFEAELSTVGEVRQFFASLSACAPNSK